MTQARYKAVHVNGEEVDRQGNCTAVIVVKVNCGNAYRWSTRDRNGYTGNAGRSGWSKSEGLLNVRWEAAEARDIPREARMEVSGAYVDSKYARMRAMSEWRPAL